MELSLEEDDKECSIIINIVHRCQKEEKDELLIQLLCTINGLFYVREWFRQVMK